MNSSHYENFPVGSLIIPKNYREPINIIYSFARNADDFADEGLLSDEVRVKKLDFYEQELKKINNGIEPSTQLFKKISQILKEFKIPIDLFFNLLSAFKQDIEKKRYQTFDELISYCSKSANPIGRILLIMFKTDFQISMKQSDFICSSLQIVNLLQDIKVDLKKSRIYLPKEELERFKVTESQLQKGIVNENWNNLMKFQINRVRVMFYKGSPLVFSVPGRFGWELRLIILGGLRILEKIEIKKYDIFKNQIKLDKKDWLLIFFRSLYFFKKSS